MPETYNMIENYIRDNRLIENKFTKIFDRKQTKQFDKINLNTDSNFNQQNFLLKENSQDEGIQNQRAYGSSHHFHKVSRDSDINSTLSHQFSTLQLKQRQTGVNFNRPINNSKMVDSALPNSHSVEI